MKKALFLIVSLLLTAVLLTGCGPSDAKELYEKANEELLAEDYESAVRDYESVIDRGAFLAEAYRGIGISRMRQGDFSKACIAFERALIQVEEQDAAFLRDVELYLAFCRTMHGEPDKALAIYDNMLNKESDADVLFLRGRIYMQQGKQELADADFDRAAELSSDYSLFINIYSIYKSHQKDADGAAYLERALEIANREESSDYDKGLVHYYLQNYSVAKDHLIQATRNDPSNTSALLLLGRVYLSMDDIASARAMFKDHLEQENLAAVAYNGLALCEIADGNYEEALSLIQSGLALQNEQANQSLRFNEIVAYEKMQDFETAYTRAASYVTYYPTDEAGLREMEFLRSRAE